MKNTINKNNKIYFFIPCDIYVRDFDARLLLALNLIKNTDNLEFIFGSQYEVNNFIIQNKFIKKFIYYEKGIDERYSSWYHYLVNRECLIYTLSEEGGIFEKNRNLISFDIDTDNFDAIRKNFIWSNFIYEKLKSFKKHFFKHSEFLVTGNPRFDLCSTKYNNFHDKFLNNFKKKKCIVVSSTFSAGNYLVPDESSIIRFFSKKNFLKNSYKFDKNREVYSNKLREYFISLTKEISHEYPYIQIFFRPHPVESHEIYKKAFKKNKNIIINNSVPARDMIAISETIIHHDCTTAVECYLNNKKPIAYLPIFDEYLTQELPIKLSLAKETVKDIKIQINQILKKKKKLNLPKENFKYFLENFKCTSYEKITKIILDDIKNPDKLIFKKIQKKFTKTLYRYLESFIIRSLNKTFEIISKISLSQKISRSYKYNTNVRITDLNYKIKNLSKIISINKKIYTKKIKKNLFLLKIKT